MKHITYVCVRVGIPYCSPCFVHVIWMWTCELYPNVHVITLGVSNRSQLFGLVINIFLLCFSSSILISCIIGSLVTWRPVLQYIPRNMHTVFALLCFVVVIHWLVFPYPPGLLHWHCGNLTIAPMPAKQPWWIWINTSCEFIMNDCITTTKQSTTKPCAYFMGYTVGFWI